MLKFGDIDPAHTPRNADTPEKQASLDELDGHPVKRLADVVVAQGVQKPVPEKNRY